MKKFILIFLLLHVAVAFGQERMTLKPADFNPLKVVSPKIVIRNQGQYFISYTRSNAVSTFANIRIFPSFVNQTGASAVIITSGQLFVGTNADYGMGYYYTSNGGLNWNGGDVLPNSYNLSTNPNCVIDNTGKLYFNYADNFIVADKSYNNGINWTGRVNVTPANTFDWNNFTADAVTGSPYIGRLYATYSDFSLSSPAIIFTYSTNSGTSYNASLQIGSPLPGHYENGSDIQVGTNGEVYCVWASINQSTNIEDKIIFSKSVNGGVNWTSPTAVLSINGVRGYLSYTGVRVSSFPSISVDRSGGSRNGYIYITWGQKNLAPAGSDPDICFSFSSNSGSSWSSPVRVNNDALNNGRSQFTPAITVDQTNGKIAVIFYDSRDGVIPDSCNTYLAISNDGGQSFTNIKVSDRMQKPAPLAGYSDGYFADYISVSANNDIVYSFWTDNRNGNAQVYFAKAILAPFITFTPLKDTENLSGPYSVNTTINTFGTGLSNAKIFWGRTTLSDSISMTSGGGENWSASIPGNGSPAQYVYYIKAADNNGRVTTLPGNAPADVFSFNAGVDVTKPVITHTPIGDVPKSLWPDTLSAYVTDNKGVDSAWVRWYKNSPSNGINHFRINTTGNDYYTGIFNSNQSQVSNNDSIFYRIFAVDNSSNRNSDSTILYKFKIGGIVNAIIGSGNAAASYPFRTFYTDSRTDMLYLASEINSAGGGQGRISRIGFNFLNATPLAINGFNIKIQHTANSSLTGFTSSGWTTVFSGTYTPPGTGWQYINLTTPFIWNGTDNLLVEVCFDNSTINTNSSVYSTPALNMVWHQAQDLSAGNGCTDLISGSVQVNRPNVSLTFNFSVNVNIISTSLPQNFSLGQNYPNPFNPNTIIRFQIPSVGSRSHMHSGVLALNTSLKVFDILGREVVTLVNEKLQPGTYEVPFYIDQFSGNHFSSGVYFYRLTAGDFSDVKRMIILK